MSSSQPTSPRVLRIPRSDEADSHVLVHVTRDYSANLTLAATEGEHPYVGSGILHPFHSTHRHVYACG